MCKDNDPAGAPEIEVTPEMIEAGLGAIGPFDLRDAVDGYLSRESLIVAVFRAMDRAR